MLNRVLNKRMHSLQKQTEIKMKPRALHICDGDILVILNASNQRKRGLPEWTVILLH